MDTRSKVAYSIARNAANSGLNFKPCSVRIAYSFSHITLKVI